MAADRNSSNVSGISDAEAKELHSGFMTMTIIYVAIALVAHFLMWSWRPWFPGTPGYKATSSLMDGATALLSMLT